MIPHEPYEPPGMERELTADPARLMSPEEYLAFELAAETKHEYHDGRVYAMAGASPRHNRIVANLIVHLGVRLRGGGCRIYPSDLRLRVEATGLYTYPDVTVVCGAPAFGPGGTLLNPTLLIEVLSPTTERYDRGRKAEHYRTIESLWEYVLIGQDHHRVERYARTGERQWTLTEAIGPEDTIALGAIGCVLSLSDVYEDID
jgi:Uma2 family endonuclease